MVYTPALLSHYCSVSSCEHKVEATATRISVDMRKLTPVNRSVLVDLQLFFWGYCECSW